MKRKISGIVVVEGKSDTQKLLQYYDVQTFETNGLGLNEEMLEVLKELARKQRIIVLTDPDGPGERIRQKIMAVVPNAEHVMIDKGEAISQNKKKLGVEYAGFTALERAFANTHEPACTLRSEFLPYEQSDMVSYGFVAHADSKKRRDYVTRALHLGRINAKQFLKRLNLFMIARSELEAILAQYLKEVGGNV